MTLRLTPANLIAAYDYLKTTAPFNKWKLPDADDLEFHITSDTDLYGHFEVSGSKRLPIIGASALRTKTTPHLLETVAHEMTHLKRFIDAGRRGLNHGPKFKALALSVCQAHGFDPKTF